MEGRIEAIRYLASRDTQDYYIVNGTTSEYLLPEELINSGLEFVRLVELGRIGSSLTASQRDRLAELKVALEAAETDSPNDELIARNPAWASVREAAQRFLSEYDGIAERPAG